MLLKHVSDHFLLLFHLHNCTFKPIFDDIKYEIATGVLVTVLIVILSFSSPKFWTPEKSTVHQWRRLSCNHYFALYLLPSFLVICFLVWLFLTLVFVPFPWLFGSPSQFLVLCLGKQVCLSSVFSDLK